MSNTDDTKLIAALDRWHKVKQLAEEYSQTERSLRMALINLHNLSGRKYLSDGRRIDVERRYRKFKLKPGVEIPSIPKHLADRLLTTNVTLNSREFGGLTPAEKEAIEPFVVEQVSEYGSIKMHTLEKPEEQRASKDNSLPNNKEVPGL